MDNNRGGGNCSTSGTLASHNPGCALLQMPRLASSERMRGRLCNGCTKIGIGPATPAMQYDQCLLPTQSRIKLLRGYFRRIWNCNNRFQEGAMYAAISSHRSITSFANTSSKGIESLGLITTPRNRHCRGTVRSARDVVNPFLKCRRTPTGFRGPWRRRQQTTIESWRTKRRQPRSTQGPDSIAPASSPPPPIRYVIPCNVSESRSQFGRSRSSLWCHQCTVTWLCVSLYQHFLENAKGCSRLRRCYPGCEPDSPVSIILESENRRRYSQRTCSFTRD
jgi:hypothetical protein